MEHANCHHLLDSLSDFIDDSLSEDLCAEIKHHMDDCEDCRVVVDTLRKTVYLYRSSAPSPEVPKDVRQRLFHRLDLDEYLQ